MKKKVLVFMFILMFICGMANMCLATNKKVMGFTDIDENDWYYNSVRFAFDNNIIAGYNQRIFAPEDNLTRGMLVTILYRMDGAKQNDGKSKFEDVDSKEWFAEPIKWADENGIIHGYAGTNKFGPNDNIIRQDLAGILRNYAMYKNKDVKNNGDISTFKDADKVSEYAKESMKWAVGAKVVTGNSDGTLNPLGNATRAETAAMIQKYCIRVDEKEYTEDVTYNIEKKGEATVSIEAIKDGKSVKQEFKLNAPMGERKGTVFIPDLGKVALVTDSAGEYGGINVYQLQDDKIVLLATINVGADVLGDAEYNVEVNNETSVTITATYKENDIFQKLDMNAAVAYTKVVDLLGLGKFVLVAETGGEYYAIHAYSLCQDYTTGKLEEIRKIGTIDLSI